MQPGQAAVREIASIATSAGTMEFELYQDVSPRTVANFKYLAESRYYDGMAFHRLIPGFMAQGGCSYTRNDVSSQNAAYYGQGGPEYTIPDEPTTRSDRKHGRGVLSMAKTETANSGGSQFFIMFGDAPWLDSVHAPIGRMIEVASGASTNASAQTLAALEAKPRVGSSSVPVERLAIQSIRIRSEITGEIPRYQSGTVGGLLRPVDRSSIRGKYTFTLGMTGGFSGKIQYQGRECSFVGKLPNLSASSLEKEATVLADASSATPLRVRVRVRQSASFKNSVSLSVCSIAQDGSDVLDGSEVYATSELSGGNVLSPTFATPTLTTGGTVQASASDTLLSTRYTIGFSRADSGNGAALLPELQGCGFMTLSINPSTGLGTVTGRLADNRSVSFSLPIANEGGRLSLSLFSEEVVENLTTMKTLNLGSLAAVQPVFQLRGVLELPKNNSIVADGTMRTLNSGGDFIPYASLSNYLFWHQNARTAGSIKNQIGSGYILPTITRWRAPKSGTTLNPFTSGKTSGIYINGSLAGIFQTKTNTAATFSASIPGMTMTLNPTDGTFSGAFYDTSVAPKVRRAFQGVFIQRVGSFPTDYPSQVGNGVGFTLLTSSSLPIFIRPVLP